MSLVSKLAAQKLAPSAVSNFDAARFSADRGFIYYPHIESEKAVDKYSRGELMKKSCWAYDNHGFVRGLLDNAAEMCGDMRPKAATSDDTWNKLADAAWERATGNAEVFDVSGKMTGEDLLEAIFLGKFRLGDCGVALGRTDDYQARIRFYESYSIGDDPDSPDDRFHDGLLLDRNKKAQRYRILTENGHKDFARQDFIFFCDYPRTGQSRGVPDTHHLLNHIHDTGDIIRYWKGNVKASSQIAMQIVNSKRDGGPAGLGGAYKKQNSSSSGRGDVYVEDLNNRNKIIELGDERIELLHDDRPSPDQVKFLDYLKRDMALGFGLPVEVVWDMSELGGANSRAILDKAQKWINKRRRKVVRGGANRLRNWVIALEMKSGRLPMCKDPEWWKHVWLPGALLTADFAKDGRAMLEILRSGEMTPNKFHAIFGSDVDEDDDQLIALWKRRKEKCEAAGIPFEMVYTPAPGTGINVMTDEQMQNLKGDKDA